jgi:intein/homing endonuclease/GGDEF domain-containing protein
MADKDQKLVKVNGVGTIAFPGDMPDDEISAHIRKTVSSPSRLKTLLKPTPMDDPQPTAAQKKKTHATSARSKGVTTEESEKARQTSAAQPLSSAIPDWVNQPLLPKVEAISNEAEDFVTAGGSKKLRDKQAAKMAEFDKSHPVQAGVAAGIDKFSESMTTPTNIGLLLAAPESKIMSAYFAFQAAKGAYHNAKDAEKAYREGKNPEAYRHLMEVFSETGKVSDEDFNRAWKSHQNDLQKKMAEDITGATLGAGVAGMAGAHAVKGTAIDTSSLRDYDAKTVEGEFRPVAPHEIVPAWEKPFDPAKRPPPVRPAGLTPVHVEASKAIAAPTVAPTVTGGALAAVSALKGQAAALAPGKTPAALPAPASAPPSWAVTPVVQPPAATANPNNPQWQQNQSTGLYSPTSPAQPALADGTEKPPAEDAQPTKYKYGNTQADVPADSEAGKALAVARTGLDKNDLMPSNNTSDGGGLENDAHITVRYGIDGEDTAGIKAYLEKQAPFEATLGKTTAFPPSESSGGGAPVVASIESPELRKMEQEIDGHGNFIDRTFPEYKPHVTLGYVKPEAAQKYVGMKDVEGKKFTVNSVSISKRDGSKEEVQLKGTPGVQTTTPEFKQWFGDWEDKSRFSSKTADSNKPPVSVAIDPKTGEPLKMYHATSGDFNKFETGRPSKNSWAMGSWDTNRHGIFMTPDPAAAQEFLKEDYDPKRRFNQYTPTTGSNVMPLYLKVTNPLDLRPGSSEVDEDFLAQIEKEGINPRWVTNGTQHTWELFDDEDGKNFVDALKRMGYDGARLEEPSGIDTWVAFDPEQVKSATGNQGTFDANNADITKNQSRVVYQSPAAKPEAITTALTELANINAELEKNPPPLEPIDNRTPEALKAWKEKHSEWLEKAGPLLDKWSDASRKLETLSTQNLGQIRKLRDGGTVLYLSPQGLRSLYAGFGGAPTLEFTLNGASLAANVFDPIMRNLDIREPLHYMELQNLLKQARDANGVVTVAAIPQKGEKLSDALGRLREELNHGWQKAFADAVGNHLKDLKFHHLNVSMPGGMYSHLERNYPEYPDDGKPNNNKHRVLEATAKLMSESPQKFGVTEEEYEAYLKQYFEAVEQEHGEKALDELVHITTRARAAKEEFRNAKRGVTGSAEDEGNVSGLQGRDAEATGPEEKRGVPEGDSGAIAPRGIDWLVDGARDFAAKHGRDINFDTNITPDFRAMEIADAYDAMQHNPSDPQVARAYGALKKDIDEQWNYATKNLGVTFEPWNKAGQPYANSKEMVQDVKNNKHLFFFQGGDMPADHPLAEIDPKSGLTYNDTLRCFTAGALVRADNGFVAIESLKVGDKVLTAQGNWKRITKVGNRKHDGEVIDIQTNGSFSTISVTPEHPFFVLRGNHRKDKKSACTPYICDRFFRGRGRGVDVKKSHSFEWVKAGDLVSGTWYPLVTDLTATDRKYVAVPEKHRTHTKGPSAKGPQRFELTPDFLWFVGLYIAEGCVGDNKIVFALHRKETLFAERVISAALKYGYGTTTSDASENGIAININSSILMKWFSSWLGSGASNKRIPQELLRLPKGKLKHLIQGIIDGDGRKSRNNIEQTSLHLALQLVEASRRLGFQPTTKAVDRDNEKHHDVYRVHEVVKTDHRQRQKKYTWQVLGKDCRQMKISKRQYTGTVYNLSVEDDETYVVENIPTHNCVHDLFGHAMEGYQFGPRGEENAWNAHSQMFSPEAVPAITSDTKGQNSWVNFGPHMRNAEGGLMKPGEPGWIPPTDRPYAENKAGILPEHYHYRVESPVSFVSPNVHDINLEQAGVRIGSLTQRGMANLSGSLARDLNLQPVVRSATGFWEGGAENTLIHHFAPGANPDAVLYHALNMAKLGNQNAHITFFPQESGADRMYAFEVPSASGDTKKIADLLLANGIKGGTIEPTPHGNTVMVSSEGESLQDNIKKIATALGVKHVGRVKGRSVTQGDFGDRAAASREFDRHIGELEQRYPGWGDVRRSFESRPDYADVHKRIRETKPEDLFLEATHGSRVPDLTELDPTKGGTGPQKGAELKRAQAAPEIYQPRTYLQQKGTVGERPYTHLSNQYEALLNKENLYDLEKDPDHLWDKVPARYKKDSNQAITYFEKLAKDAGYDGVLDPRQGVIEAFKNVPVKKIENRLIPHQQATPVHASANKELTPQSLRDQASQLMKRPTRSYDDVQRDIDDMETKLEDGNGPRMFYFTRQPGHEILKGAVAYNGVPYEPMPPELEDLYDERDKIGSKQLQQSIDEISGALEKSGIKDDAERRRVLDYYMLDPKRTDAAKQYLASEYTMETVNRPLLKQAEDLYSTLAPGRDIPMDDRDDLWHNRELTKDAHAAVKAVHSYFYGGDARALDKPRGVEPVDVEKSKKLSTAPIQSDGWLTRTGRFHGNKEKNKHFKTLIEHGLGKDYTTAWQNGHVRVMHFEKNKWGLEGAANTAAARELMANGVERLPDDAQSIVIDLSQAPGDELADSVYNSFTGPSAKIEAMDWLDHGARMRVRGVNPEFNKTKNVAPSLSGLKSEAEKMKPKTGLATMGEAKEHKNLNDFIADAKARNPEGKPLIEGRDFDGFFATDNYDLRHATGHNMLDPESVITGREISHGMTYANSQRQYPDIETYVKAASGTLGAGELQKIAPRVRVDGTTKVNVEMSKQRKPGPNNPGVGVEDRTRHSLWPAFRVQAPKSAKLPEGKLIDSVTKNATAARSIANLDDILGKHPDAAKSIDNWTKMTAYAFNSHDTPVPPYALIRDINGDGAERKLEKLTPEQIEHADFGLQNAKEFHRAYTSGELGVATTGKLFLWSILSRGQSPYTQESMFIDAFNGAAPWIEKAAQGKFSEYDLSQYEKWALSVAAAGSESPGGGATSNLNSFGQHFLSRMSKVREDGRTHLQYLHDMLCDPKMTGQQIRREFNTFKEGVGVDNKVMSFSLLVTGHPDVFVLDRVQFRQLWDDGRFNGLNIYDGHQPEGETKYVKGSRLGKLGEGVRGLLYYEAIEKAVSDRVHDIYRNLGREDDASVGRYHWESWIAESGQEASHATLEAILDDAKGDDLAIAGVAARQGEFGSWQYATEYFRDEYGKPFFAYQTALGNRYGYSVPNYRGFMAELPLARNGVVKYGFKVELEKGDPDANIPWYNRPGVNQQKLDELARKWSDFDPREGRRTASESSLQQKTASDSDRTDFDFGSGGDGGLTPSALLEQAKSLKPVPVEMNKTYTGPERRQNPAFRKRVSDMTPEEMKTVLLRSYLVDLPNRRAFDEDQLDNPAPAVARSDADALKAFNDKFGYEYGDTLLHAKADALKEVGLNAYHEKGDEFLFRGESAEDLKTKLEKAREILRNTIFDVTLDDGTKLKLKGVDFSYGTGKDLAEAEAGQHAHKEERERAGERRRGELAGITEVGAGEDQEDPEASELVTVP